MPGSQRSGKVVSRRVEGACFRSRASKAGAVPNSGGVRLASQGQHAFRDRFWPQTAIPHRLIGRARSIRRSPRLVLEARLGRTISKMR